MHFWIDKRSSQRCGFNGRHLVPPSLSGYGRRHPRFLRTVYTSGGSSSNSSSCSSSSSGINNNNNCNFYLKPMVTPVHRFQSIESVANNRNANRLTTTITTRPSVFNNVITNNNNNNNNNNANTNRSLEMITATNNNSIQISRNIQNTIETSPEPTTKVKCSVWIFFVILTFFLAGSARYYFHGGNIGIEAFAFCSLIIIILVVGGLVSLYGIIKRAPYATSSPIPSTPLPAYTNEQQSENSEQQQQQQQQIENRSNHHYNHHHHYHHHNNHHRRRQYYQQQVPTTFNDDGDGLSEIIAQQLPPPPYHIAIMLPSTRNIADINQTIRDSSPPPSYEKAVT